MSGASYGIASMTAFQRFDPYLAASKPNRGPPKLAKVPKVAGPSRHPEVTLAGLGTLGDLPANIVKPIGSHCFGCPDHVGRNRTYPVRCRVPADWIDGLERMPLRACPIAIHPKHWLQLQDAARRFVGQWGEQAA